MKSSVSSRPRSAASPGETLASRLRRAVSLASRTPPPPQPSLTRSADPSHIHRLAQPKNPLRAGGPPSVERRDLLSPPLDDLHRAQMETGPQYHGLPATMDRVRVALAAEDAGRRPRRLVRNKGGRESAVVTLTRPRFDERRNSLLRFYERTGVDVIVLVLDLRLQIVGSLCLAYGEPSCPSKYSKELGAVDGVAGIEVSPAYLSVRRKPRPDDSLRANALEVDFSILPTNVFAIVPVVVAAEDCSGGTLRCKLFGKDWVPLASSDSGRAERECDGLALEPQQETSDTRDEESSFDETDFGGDPGPLDFERKFATVREWRKVAECCWRMRQVSENSASSKCYLKQACVPFVLFRHSSVSSFPWGVQATAECVEAIDMAAICSLIPAFMLRLNIVPFCSVHIEHCRNCEQHTATSRHKPGSYQKHFQELRNFLKSRLPPMFFYANHSNCIREEPRLGSFEITALPYGTSLPQLLYSKLSRCDFPVYRRVLRAFAALLLPEITKLVRPRELIVRVIDESSRRPIVGALVEIIKIKVEVTSEKSFGDPNLRRSKSLGSSLGDDLGNGVESDGGALVNGIKFE